MASHLTLLSAFGAAPSSKPVTKPTAREDNAFSSMVEAKPAPTKRTDRTTASEANTNTSPSEARGSRTEDSKAQAEKTSTEATADAAVAEKPAEDSATETPISLPEALLAALTAVITAPEGQAEGSALKDVEDALDALADALGMDLSSLVQQLTKLVEANGGAEDGDLGAKLNEWLAKTLGTPLEDIAPEIQANLARFIDAAKKWAQPLPTEPDLAEPVLKMSEPVLTGKTTTDTTADAKAAPAGSEKEPARAAQGAALSENKPADTAQNRPAQTPVNSPAGPTEAAAPMAVTQAVQADSATLPTESSAAAPRVVQAGYQTSQQQINLPQIAFELARQVDSGNTRFQIRLDPPELGRIDVKLDIDSNGQVNARLTVEKAETLDLMQRDQRALERALQQAGLDANKTNLEFSLKQNPFAGDQNERSGHESGTADLGEDNAEGVETPPAVTLYRGALQASGLNIIA